MKSLLLALCIVCGAGGWVGAEEVPVWQEGLLEISYGAVSAMPLDPHIKNRSREQYKVVGAALTLDRPDLADRYAHGIAYWQQGAVLADLALYHVEHGNPERGRLYLEKAEAWVGDHSKVYAEQGDEQAWRLSRVGTRIALVYTALSEDEKVAETLPFVDRVDLPRLLEYKISHTPENDLDASVATLGSMADGGEFEAIKSALKGLAVLYDRFYENPSHRGAIEDAFEACLPKVPYLMQIALVAQLGEAAVSHGDRAEAARQAARAYAMLEKHESYPRFRIPLAARIAALNAVAGNLDTAQQQLDESLKRFEENQKLIVNIDRAGILCSLAEAHVKAGDPDHAMELYLRAISEGQVNPNSRPRATDLNHICCSMATHGIEPTAPVFQALEEMRNKLGNPW